MGRRIFGWAGRVCIAADKDAAKAAMGAKVAPPVYDLTDGLMALIAGFAPTPPVDDTLVHEVADLRAENMRLKSRLMGGGAMPYISDGPMPKPEPVLSALAMEFAPYVKALNAEGLSDGDIARRINRDLGTDRLHAMAVCAIKRELGLAPAKRA